MSKDVLRLSTVTFHAAWGQKEHNLNRIIDYIDAAADQGSNFVIFPEMALTGYDDESDKLLHDKMQYKEAETIPGPSTDRIAAEAEKKQIYVVVGMPERDTADYEKLYNAIAIFTPEGLAGSYRKMHPHDDEPNWCQRGEKPFLLDTPWGPIGCEICYDIYAFPELRRYYTAKGARLMINSTALAHVHGRQFGTTTLESGVLQDGIYIASSNLGGVDLINNFWGGSSIIGPSQQPYEVYYYAGKRFTDPGADESKMYTATIDLSLATRFAFVTNPKLGTSDWRPDKYAEMLADVLNGKKQISSK